MKEIKNQKMNKDAIRTYSGITGKNSKFYSNLFFIIGIIGAIGFRVILFLNIINPFFGIISWYIAIIAYLFFYSYRWYINYKRVSIIIKNKLKEKIQRNELEMEDRNNIIKLLDSLLVSRAKWNYFILFIISILAIIIEIII